MWVENESGKQRKRKWRGKLEESDTKRNTEKKSTRRCSLINSIEHKKMQNENRWKMYSGGWHFPTRALATWSGGGVVTHDAEAAVALRSPRTWRSFFRDEAGACSRLSCSDPCPSPQCLPCFSMFPFRPSNLGFFRSVPFLEWKYMRSSNIWK